MVAYFCHHLSDNYVDLSNIHVPSVISDWKWQQIWSEKNKILKVSFLDIYNYKNFFHFMIF